MPPLIEWRPNLELAAKPGTERSYYGLDGLVPLRQDGTSLLFFDGKARVQDTWDANELNLGLGYRRYTESQKWALGFYGAWDRRRTRLEVVLSTFFNDLTHGGNCSYDLATAARHYARIFDLVQHYLRELDVNYLAVRY